MDMEDLKYMKAEQARRGNWREVRRINTMIGCHMQGIEQRQKKLKRLPEIKVPKREE